MVDIYSKEQGIEVLPEDYFSDFRSLWEVDLSGNKLTALSEVLFSNNIALTRIDISRNQLKSIPNILFGHLTALKFLWLNQNQLTRIPERLISESDKFNCGLSPRLIFPCMSQVCKVLSIILALYDRWIRNL
jgi:Leucine-rich repeat (LRR) protein